MKTLARRMTKTAVTHYKKNHQRHSRRSRFRVDLSVEIDLDVGRVVREEYRPKRLRRYSSKETPRNLDYRPPDYKPSWDPEELCTGCREEIGLKYLPVLFKDKESGLLKVWHNECLNVVLRTTAKARVREVEDLSEEKVAV